MRVAHIAAAALVITACADLGPLETQLCGNGVVESQHGEFCDGAPGCIAGDEEAACSWGCSSTECPDGFSCGLDGVCRKPGFRLQHAAGLDVEEAWVTWVDAHDLDADGRDDLLYMEMGQLDFDGHLRIAFMDSAGAAAKVLEWRETAARPSVGDIDDDGLPDLMLTGNTQWLQTLPTGTGNDLAGLTALRNDGDRDFIPMLVGRGWTELAEPKGMVLSDFYGLHWIDGDRLVPALHADTEEGLAGTMPAVPALRCARTALATSGTRAAFVAGAQTNAMDAGLYEGPITVIDPNTAEVHTLGFPDAGARAYPWVMFFDLNSDGREDLLAQSASPSAVHVAWGQSDGGFHSTPQPPLGMSGSDWQLSFLLDTYGPVAGAQDINDDGVLDFAFAEGLAVSKPCTGPACDLPGYDYDLWWFGWDLIQAVFADVTGDGRLNVIGTSGDDHLHILRYADPEYGSYEPTSIPFTPIAELATGDLDFDNRADVVVLTDEAVFVIWSGTLDSLGPVLLLQDVALGPGLVTDDEEEVLKIATFDADGRTGFERLFEVADRRVASGIEPFHDVEGATPGGWYQNAVVGHFSPDHGAQIALAGATIDNFTVSDQVEAVRFVERENGFYEFVRDTPFLHQSTPGFEDIMPDFTAVAATQLAADLDGDGLDELILVGSVVPEATPSWVTAAGDGFVGVWRQQAGAWELVTGLQLPGLTTGGTWPYVLNAHPVELVDVDVDGDLDLFMLANATRGDYVGAPEGGARTYAVIENVDGELVAPARSVESTGGPWKSWSFLGPGPDGAQRVAHVIDGALIVGSFDPDTLEVDEHTTLPLGDLEQGIWSTAGDFNGDGLTDLALAQGGASIYLGVPEPPA